MIEDEGTTTIPAGSLDPVTITFNVTFPVNPSVSAWAEDPDEKAYLLIEDVTTTGCTVRWNKTRPNDSLVGWTAKSPDLETLAAEALALTLAESE